MRNYETISPIVYSLPSLFPFFFRSEYDLLFFTKCFPPFAVCVYRILWTHRFLSSLGFPVSNSKLRKSHRMKCYPLFCSLACSLIRFWRLACAAVTVLLPRTNWLFPLSRSSLHGLRSLSYDLLCFFAIAQRYKNWRD